MSQVIKTKKAKQGEIDAQKFYHDHKEIIDRFSAEVITAERLDDGFYVTPRTIDFLLVLAIANPDSSIDRDGLARLKNARSDYKPAIRFPVFDNELALIGQTVGANGQYASLFEAVVDFTKGTNFLTYANETALPEILAISSRLGRQQQRGEELREVLSVFI